MPWRTPRPRPRPPPRPPSPPRRPGAAPAHRTPPPPPAGRPPPPGRGGFRLGVKSAVALCCLGVQRGLLPQQLTELGGVLAAGGHVGRRHRLDLLTQRGELLRRRNIAAGL